MADLRSFALCGHTGRVVSVAWSPCSKYLATSSIDKTVRVWGASTGKCLKVLEGHAGWVMTVAWSPCGRYVVTGSHDRTARVWRFDVSDDLTSQDGECLHVLRGHTNIVNSVAWSPLLADGSSILATGSNDCTVRVWRFDVSKNISEDGTFKTTSELFQVLTKHIGHVTSVAWSPLLADGSTMLATGSYDKTARVLCFGEPQASGACLSEIGVLTGHTNGVTSVAWSPCSQYLATGSYDNTVRVWCAPDKVVLLKWHTDWVLSVAWSPAASLANGSRMFATGSEDRTARVWRFDVSHGVSETSKDGECLKVLEGHTTGSVLSVAWSPCGTRVVTGSCDKTARIWTLCKWTHRTHCTFPPTARRLARQVMCARDRLAAAAIHRNANDNERIPLEIWFEIFKIIFSN